MCRNSLTETCSTSMSNCFAKSLCVCVIKRRSSGKAKKMRNPLDAMSFHSAISKLNFSIIIFIHFLSLCFNVNGIFHVKAAPYERDSITVTVGSSHKCLILLIEVTPSTLTFFFLFLCLAIFSSFIVCHLFVCRANA